MERVKDFFRVRKLFFTWLLLLGLSVTGVVFAVGLPADFWWVGFLTLMAGVSSAIGVCYGIYVTNCQLSVRKRLSTPETMTPKQRVKQLRRKRVGFCMEYANAETGSAESEALSAIRTIDKELEELTGVPSR